AFSIASGLTPQAGIYCAIVTGLLISALGGSKTQIGGPTGAFVVVVAGIVAAHGVDGLFMCTVMAGILLVVMGATGMGTGVKFIPRPVVIGFTNGIAVLIASTQVKDFFGLHLERVPGVFWLRMKALAANSPTWSPTATILAVATVATMLVCRILSKRIPGPIVAMLGAHRHGFCIKAARGDYRHALRRNPLRPSPPCSASLACGAGSWTARAGVHRGDAGCDRVADVGGGLRPHEQRPPQSERGTDRPGSGEHHVADVRRAARHWRD